jgi:hypothetical protein
VSNVIDALVEQLVDVVVDQGVENVLALFAGCNKPQRTEQSQMVRDGRLAHPQHQAKVAHAHFHMGKQPDNAHTRGVRERREQLGGTRCRNAIQQVILRRKRQRGIVVVIGADGNTFFHGMYCII